MHKTFFKPTEKSGNNRDPGDRYSQQGNGKNQFMSAESSSISTKSFVFCSALLFGITGIRSKIPEWQKDNDWDPRRLWYLNPHEIFRQGDKICFITPNIERVNSIRRSYTLLVKFSPIIPIEFPQQEGLLLSEQVVVFSPTHTHPPQG